MEQSWREFQILHDAMENTSKDKGPQALGELIAAWQKDSKGVFVVSHPVTAGMTFHV